MNWVVGRAFFQKRGLLRFEDGFEKELSSSQLTVMKQKKIPNTEEDDWFNIHEIFVETVIFYKIL